MEKEVKYMDPVNFNLSAGNPKWTITEVIEGEPITKLVDGIPIDKNIAESISKLNKLGYRTNFCCEGHFDDSQAYIQFHPSVPLEKIYNLLSVADMWELNKQDYRDLSIIQIEPKINLVNMSHINHESEEYRTGYEYFKRIYLDNLEMGIRALDEYEFIDNGLRPIVSEVTLSKSKVIISGYFYIHNDNINDLNKVSIGDAVCIHVEDKYYNYFTVKNIEVNMNERVKITCCMKIGNGEKIINDIFKYFYNKPMYFKKLGDFKED